MKKIIMVWLIAVVFLAGCGTQKNVENTEFSLTKNQRADFKETIDQVLYDFYWGYEEDSVAFFPGVVPENSEANERVFSASDEAGYALKNFAGKEAVVATVKLQHFNGDQAGLAYFYFVKNRLVGAYYSGGYDHQNYSLDTRNLFLADGKFAKYETNEPMGSFLDKFSVSLSEGFSSAGADDQGEWMAVAVENGRAVLYRYRNGIQKMRTLRAGGGRRIMAATFLPEHQEKLAVIEGDLVQQGEEEGEHTQTASVKVVFYQPNFAKAGEEIALSSSQYSCIAVDGSNLVLADGNILEYYKKVQGVWQKDRQFFLKHGVTDFLVTDLDQDGTKEYMMTDGLDLFLYHKTGEGFSRIWCTHVGVEALSGSLYAGDLNQDGVKELYICDNTGTAIRYILTEHGLRSRNEDILFGDRFYVSDFNGDGKDDYIGIVNKEKMSCKAFLAE